MDWDCVTIKKQEEWLEEPVVLFNCGTINEADATAGVIYSTSDIEDFGCEVAEVIRKTGGHTNVVISATYKELPVALIQSCAFFGDSNLKSVVIPNSVKYIGSWAFYNCENLSSATIPSSVTDFGDDVFDGCGNLVIKGEAGSYAEKYAKENENALIEGSAEFFHEVIFTFPYAVATIPDEIYLVSSVKNKILKECILFVASKLKVQSIYDSNKELGSLLENAGQISDISEFARELRNYFNVVVKQCIKRQSPELAEEADYFLRCYEGTEFLPVEKRVAGAAIDDAEFATEEQESKQDKKSELSISDEEMQSEEESAGEQEQRTRSTKELVDLLLADDEEDDLLSEESDSEEQQETSESEDELDRTLKELEELLLSDDEEDDDEGDDEKGDVNG